MYTLNYDAITGKVVSITNGNTSFPLEPLNADYQEFLAWNAAQDVPLDLTSSIMPAVTT